MKNYEVMYIIRPTLDEEARKVVIEEMSNIFTKNDSTVTEVKEWGLRDLAYEIEGETKGYYVLLNVSATVAAVNEFDRIANINEKVIRHIVVCA